MLLKPAIRLHKFSRGIPLRILSKGLDNCLSICGTRALPPTLKKSANISTQQDRNDGGFSRSTTLKLDPELSGLLATFQENMKLPAEKTNLEGTWELYCRIARYQKLTSISLGLLDVFVKELLDYNSADNNALSWVNRILRDCHLEGRLLDLAVYRHVLSVYSKLELYNDINNLYDDLKIAGAKLDVGCYNVIISAFEACQNRTMINRYLSEMKKAGVRMNKSTVDMLVSLELNQSRFKEAEALYEELTLEEADSLSSEKTLCRLIHGFIQTDDMASALKWYTRLESFPKEKLSVAAHNIGLALARKTKDTEKLLSAFQSLKQSDEKPDENTYVQVIGGLTGVSKGELAMQHFHEYLNSGLPYSSKVYNKALKALFSLGKVDEALSLYESMCAIPKDLSSRRAVNTHTYAELITGLCLAGHLGRARGILDKMQEVGFPPGARIYRTMIHHHMQMGKVDFAIRYFNNLVKLPSEPPNANVYSVMVFGLLSHGQIDEAMNAYFHMRRQNLFPSEQEYARIVSCLTKEKRMDMARKLFDDMVAQGISPSNATYAALISGYGHAKDLYNVMSLHLFIKMDVSRDPDIAVWNSLMNAYNLAGSHQKALQIWDMLWYMEYPLDNASVSIILDCCSHYNELDRFEVIWLLLERRGFSLNSNNYCSYVEGLARQGQVQRAVDYVTKEMRLKGIPPSLKTIDTLLSFLLKYNKSSEHRRVVAVFLRDTFPDYAHLISKRISSEF
ncbi:hypothetical protein DSO57_1035658 [Entomophthora muscae]|uniref:Uncharacterized protein n=1 Tax=Entomophthora muscae TaxID=34485 RepID=A0ACC2U941_9FUNG|nr:hypothetical protein DSO57_1035658 [Entomophthora muscae]